MIIGIALIWVAFFSVGNMPKWLDFKPFNCIICLSFWTCFLTGILITFVPESKVIIEPLEWAGFGAYAAIIMKRIIFKI